MRLISLGCAGAGNQAHGHPDRNTLGKREGLGELNLLFASALQAHGVQEAKLLRSWQL